MLSLVALTTLLAGAAQVNANGLSLAIGVDINWGDSINYKAVSEVVSNQCAPEGSFFLNYQNSPICCSSETRVAPESITCPFSWDMHKTAKCCIPPTEVCVGDCGEGYSFSKSTYKCSVNTSPSCSDSQWYHERSGTCCEKSWYPNPPSGTCPSGITCPTDWFWHATDNCCRPIHPRSPEPDCDNWDNNKQCCGSGTSPSQGSGNSGWKRKRSASAQQQQAFPQSELDAMYCPGNLHACSVPTASGEWSYECIDFATELESCGGCASTGKGQDCTSISYAKSVGCESGVCVVYSCQVGYVANGTACVVA